MDLQNCFLVEQRAIEAFRSSLTGLPVLSGGPEAGLALVHNTVGSSVVVENKGRDDQGLLVAVSFYPKGLVLDPSRRLLMYLRASPDGLTLLPTIALWQTKSLEWESVFDPERNRWSAWQTARLD